MTKQITPKCAEALKGYVINRAKYGRCGAKISIVHVRMLAEAGLIVRGPCATIESFTNNGESFVQSLFS